ncbi:hypothetical protein NQ176_g9038 [Zarea fungicola]|uniref:Uncharacterized protein n=1 Tax=Zarea fungicola TaxID=93591 RepID=A0ACC1MP49_9HYPO|nr:hypothetical protein NQ176_g9038 [Lecanicillium fungicola]
MGKQFFQYAIAPHKGGFSEAAVKQAGYNFNYPLRVVAATKDDISSSNLVLGSIKLEGPRNVVLETIKRAEDDAELHGHYPLTKRDGQSIILRVYESLGGSSNAKVVSSLPVKKAFKTNILEDNEQELTVTNGEVAISLKPFELMSIRLQL